MKLQEFEKAIEEDDFAVGDTFWTGNWEFEIVNTKAPGKEVCGDEVVFRWELTRQEFIQVIADSHPEIEDPKGFFERHEDDIVHRFRKGFDSLVGECGATYETVMSDAIDEAVTERQRSIVDRLGAERVQRLGGVQCDADVADSQPLPSCSKTCKEVDDRMEFDVQSKVNEYLELLGQLKQKTTEEWTAVSILQEISKDRRSAEIREERQTKNAEPATPKQKQFMKKLNIQFPSNVTKHEASVLIDDELGKGGE